MGEKLRSGWVPFVGGAPIRKEFISLGASLAVEFILHAFGNVVSFGYGATRTAERVEIPKEMNARAQARESAVFPGDDGLTKISQAGADVASDVYWRILDAIEAACDEESQTETQKLANITQIIDHARNG